MARITKEESDRFHLHLDRVINKLNNPKNAKKDHWSKLTSETLGKMAAVENAELDLAIHAGTLSEIETESHDLIALNLFILDNLYNNDDTLIK